MTKSLFADRTRRGVQLLVHSIGMVDRFTSLDDLGDELLPFTRPEAR
jgi:hypothetical protein